jgi:hypothetical protein
MVDDAALHKLVEQNIARTGLDLSGLTVVTGAAAGYDKAMATTAALAGARRVLAVTRESKRYPSAAEASAATLALASHAGMSSRIEIVNRVDSRDWGNVDILTDCRQVRPVSRLIVELLPRQAVIALMGEAWEIPARAVDLEACDDLGVKVAALNLDHPAMRLLPEYGRLCRMLVKDSGFAVRGARVGVVCDTPLAPLIVRELEAMGGKVSLFPHPLLMSGIVCDLVVVALQPSARPPMDIVALGSIAGDSPGTLLVQFSGEVDRSAAAYFGLKLWPLQKPDRGEFGLPFGLAGAGASLRKLVGGLKAAEAAFRGEGGEGASFVRLVKAGDKRP